MADPIPADEQSSYEAFRDCLSEPVLKSLAAPAEKPRPRSKRNAKKSLTKRGNATAKSKTIHTNGIHSGGVTASDAEDLGDFIEYLSSVIFPSLPANLRSLSYIKYKDSVSLQDTYSTPLSASTYTHLLETLPPEAFDSLESYGLLPSQSDMTDQRNLLLPVFHTYITSVTAPPPIWVTTRTTACELCDRDWVPLTYHHLIPKSTQERVMKRGWHTEEKLNSVAWLCRACHSFVHRLASNEGLARWFYTVDLIRGGGIDGDVEKRESVESWAKWVGSVRWKSR